jgi:pimeloyl-ACP methyl ester carboxylesterase
MTVSQPRAMMVLFPSLGTSTRVWDPVLAELSTRETLDVLMFDLPGHGDAPPAEGFDIPALARQALEQIRPHRSVVPVLTVGVSMGGALALEVASLPSAAVAAVASFNSGMTFGGRSGWNDLIRKVEAAGTAAFDIEATAGGWFTETFRAVAGRQSIDPLMDDLAAIDPTSYIACCRALARYDGRAAAASLAIPGLAVGGAADRATHPEGTWELAVRGRIRYAELPGAHLAIVEDAARAAALLDELIARVITGAGIAA